MRRRDFVALNVIVGALHAQWSQPREWLGFGAARGGADVHPRWFSATKSRRFMR